MSKKHGKHDRGQPVTGRQVADRDDLSHGHLHPPSTSLWANAAGLIAGVRPGALDAPVASPIVPAPGLVAVAPGVTFDLAGVDTRENGGLDKGWAKDQLRKERARISDLQEKLYAERRRSLLIVLQAIDTGGKDGTIRAVLKGVNPQGCAIASFKVPSHEELDHDFLWRYHQRTPGKGMIGVFNRSHYEDVLVVRVKGLVPDAVWRSRYAAINDFERLLTESGTTILKFFLHISKDEQKERLEARIADPAKHWKFDPADLVERKSWDSYQTAFADALGRCSTPHAPWLVVPADRKWFRNYLVAKTVADTLEAIDPRFPEGPKDIAGLKVPD
ncbi:polyphosphate kinase 2 family protein [Methylobacterium sp. J-067]|uniref:polyphosphate kinase 2 family protein n=1 Tax=Methylobacterium sp. J-067 TaxID=2836648 RepID=UPI001FB93F77|nr:polyphosphate kinase 2 family protein [Methylobacterium sp. J-067]MCJ2026840.1 polyphosphate kinase 2 family protein [Methylobacterium sp. J-067]